MTKPKAPPRASSRLSRSPVAGEGSKSRGLNLHKSVAETATGPEDRMKDMELLRGGRLTWDQQRRFIERALACGWDRCRVRCAYCNRDVTTMWRSLLHWFLCWP